MPGYRTSMSLSTISSCDYSLNQDYLILDEKKRYKFHTVDLIASLAYSWEDLFLSGNFLATVDKLSIIYNFASRFISNMEDLDPDFAEVINKHFWDLL